MAVYLGTNKVSMVGGQPIQSESSIYKGTLTLVERPEEDVSFVCPGVNHFCIWMPNGADLSIGQSFFSSVVADDELVQFAYSTRAGTQTSQTIWYATGGTSGETNIGVQFTQTGVTMKYIPDSASAQAKQYFRWFQPNTYQWVAWYE